MKIFPVTALLLIAASPSLGATIVAEYFARSRITVTVASAQLLNSGSDAYDLLQVGAWQDGSDEGVDEFGNGLADGFRNNVWDQGVFAGREFIYELSVSGSASRDVPYSYSEYGGWITPTLEYLNCVSYSCDQAEDMLLTLEYAIETETISYEKKNRGFATAEANADFLVQYLGYNTGLNYSLLRTDNGSGRLSILLKGGDGVGLDFNLSEGVGGTASYVGGEVPLPASFSVLLLGIGALTGIRFRSRQPAVLRSSNQA